MSISQATQCELKKMKEKLTVSLRCSSDVVILDELLLLANHILQVNDSAGLQLQVEEQLYVLRLQEIVLHHQLKEVLIVL